jgi:hypothetical protein
MMRWAAFLLLAGCTTVQTPVAFTGACPTGDSKCQRNRDAETLHYIGQTEAAWSLMCPDIVDQYGQVCAVY